MMRIMSGPVIILIVLCQMLAGCGRTPSEESAGSEGPKPQTVPSQQQSTVQVAAPAPLQPEGRPSAARSQPGPALAGQKVSQGKTPAAPTKKALPKDTVILRGSPLGAVKFDHKLHSEVRSPKCETCHHPSRPEKPAAVAQQVCTDCHTKVAVSPMKTKLQAAFHNPTATAGTCIDCHKAENAKGKAAPVKCAGCHKKENT